PTRSRCSASRARTTSWLASTAAAPRARPVRSASRSRARSTRSTVRTTVPPSRRPASSRATLASSSARRPVSRRPARRRSSRSADRALMPLFGTDGVRGLANGTLTADLALSLAQATAVVLGQGRSAEARRAEGRRARAVIARDPRISGQFLGAAVSAGLAASGVDVYDAGVIPTPALAFLVNDFDADFGIMISA